MARVPKLACGKISLARGIRCYTSIFYLFRQSSVSVFLKNTHTQWRTEGGGGWGVQLPEIPKVLQNRAKLNPTMKTVGKIA